MPLALVTPFAPWWGWLLLAPLLAVTGSWLAIGAVGVGITLLHPWVAPWLGALALLLGVFWGWSPVVFGRRALEWTPRGDSLDSVGGRLWGIRCALTRLTWWGHGAGSMARDLKRWTSRGVPHLHHEWLLCEPVQVVYEYGLAGGVALVAMAWLAGVVLPRLSAPVVAAGAIFLVLNLGHAPLRVLWHRLRAVFPTPPLVAEVTIHVAHDGSFRVFTPIQADASPELAAVIANAMLRAGVYWAEQRGLTLEPVDAP